MARLSAFLIVKNESKDIAGCLASIRPFVDEIVVVDDHSSDDTVAQCRAAGATVFTRSLDGFAAQKQFALDQTSGEWALSIDADERLTPALGEEIRSVLQAPAAAGFEIRRELFFLRHRLRHGGVGSDWVLRLLRKGQGRFRPVRVHERIEVDGAVRRLRHPLHHFSYASLEEYVEKCNHYTSLAAQDLWGRGRRYSALDDLRPAWELFSRILLKGAWLDGRPGLFYAALSGHAAWLRSIKLWELEKRGGPVPAEDAKEVDFA